jgi:hypothetical protein
MALASPPLDVNSVILAFFQAYLLSLLCLRTQWQSGAFAFAFLVETCCLPASENKAPILYHAVLKANIKQGLDSTLLCLKANIR